MDLILAWGRSQERHRREFAGPTTIVLGREVGVDVALRDLRVSRRHCTISVDAGAARVTDLGSANGTFVNGRECATTVLADGDRLLVGDTEVEVKLVAIARKRETPPPGAGQRTARLPNGAVVEIPGYVIVRSLSPQGPSSVFEAVDPTGTTVALKVFELGKNVSAEDRARFSREATSASMLAHPHVVRVLGQGTGERFLFMAMELVEGETLAALLERSRSKPVPIARALEIGRAIASALEAARRLGLVHRDVKPENILLGDNGEIKLADFGLAKSVLTAGSSGLTTQGDILGTIHYMAPEQFKDSIHADHRADVYSLGATLYEMLSGRPPFPWASYVGYHALVTQSRPTLLSELRPDVSNFIRLLVERCLEAAPEDRFQTAGEIVRILNLLRSNPDAGRTDAARP